MMNKFPQDIIDTIRGFVSNVDEKILIFIGLVILVAIPFLIYLSAYRKKGKKYKLVYNNLENRVNDLHNHDVFSTVSLDVGLFTNSKFQVIVKQWQKRLKHINQEDIKIIDDLLGVLDIAVKNRNYIDFDEIKPDVEKDIEEIEGKLNFIHEEINNYIHEKVSNQNVMNKYKEIIDELKVEYIKNSVKFDELEYKIDSMFSNLSANLKKYEEYQQQGKTHENDILAMKIVDNINTLNYIIKESPEFISIFFNEIKPHMNTLKDKVEKLKESKHEENLKPIEEYKKTYNLYEKVENNLQQMKFENCASNVKVLQENIKNLSTSLDVELTSIMIVEDAFTEIAAQFVVIEEKARDIHQFYIELNKNYGVDKKNLDEISFIEKNVVSLKDKIYSMKDQYETKEITATEIKDKLIEGFEFLKEINDKFDILFNEVGNIFKGEENIHKEIRYVKNIMTRIRKLLVSSNLYDIEIYKKEYFRLAGSVDEIAKMTREYPIDLISINTKLSKVKHDVELALEGVNILASTTLLAKHAYLFASRYNSGKEKNRFELSIIEELIRNSNNEEALTRAIRFVENVDIESVPLLIDSFAEKSKKLFI